MPVTVLQRAQNLAALLPPLLIEAERVADTVYQGVHGRRRAGVGETFWQFRPYTTGDAASRIDWRQSARGDKAYVREREWEAAQTAALWADISGSMRYASTRDVPVKAERAQVLMLALASLMLRGGEKILWLDGKNPQLVQGKAGLERIVAETVGNAVGASLPPSVPLPRHAHVVLCSDFLMPDDELHTLMQGYAALNLRGALVHILDPIEESFAFDGRIEMLGCEGESPMLVPNAAAIADAYRQKLAAHKARLQQLAASAGWNYVRHTTNEKPHLALMQIYQGLSAEG